MRTKSTKKTAAGKTAAAKNKRTVKSSASSGRATQPAKRTGRTKKTKGKNVSEKIQNGTFVITNDQYFYGADGKSKKKRMGTVVDSNKKDEIALVKYTTSKKHGREFVNDKGFKGHADKTYTLDNEGKPIKLGEGKFTRGNPKRDISSKTANEIKRRNVKESKYKAGNRANLRNLKGRKKK